MATKHRLPTISPYRYFAAAGGLLSYGPDTVDQYRLAASYVDRILKGEKPADLPVQFPTKRTKPSTTCSGMGRASGVSVCSMTARGWQSGPRRSQSEKCHRKFQLRRLRPPERPGRGCDRD